MPPLFSKVKVVQLPNSFSDGDVSSHPLADDAKLFADDQSKLFHRGLAKMWYEKKGLPIPSGVSLEFGSLPVGFAVYSCKRAGTSHTDRYLYGLHAGRFRSSNEFFPHFEYLMGNASTACKCRFCNRKKVSSERAASSSTAGSQTRASVRQTFGASVSTINKRKRGHSRGREAHNEWNDPYTRGLDPHVHAGNTAPGANGIEQHWNAVNKNCLNVLLRDLERFGTLKRSLNTTDNPPGVYPAWANLEQQSTWNSSKPQWCPRRGEVIFYLEGMNVNTDRFGWDTENQRFVMVQSGLVDRRKMEWRVGLVVQPPQDNEPKLQALSSMNDTLAGIHLDDQVIGIQRLAESAGPHASNDDIFWLLISQMRHLSEYTQVLNGLTSEDCESSLRLLQSLMKSIAPWGQYQFEGRWPRAIISCKGVWVEGELIQIGDAAWIRDGKSDEISEVIVVSHVEIRYVFVSRDSLQNTPHDSQVQSVRIAVMGQVYSRKPSRLAPGQSAIRNSGRLPKAMQGYVWFPVAAGDLAVFAEAIKGRLYEHECYEIMYRRNPDGLQSQSYNPSILDKSKYRATNPSSPNYEPNIRAVLQPDLRSTWRICNHRDEQLGINLSPIFNDHRSGDYTDIKAISGSSDELGKEGVFS